MGVVGMPYRCQVAQSGHNYQYTYCNNSIEPRQVGADLGRRLRSETLVGPCRRFRRRTRTGLRGEGGRVLVGLGELAGGVVEHARVAVGHAV